MESEKKGYMSTTMSELMAIVMRLGKRSTVKNNRQDSMAN